MKKITEATFEDSPQNAAGKAGNRSSSKTVVRTPSEAMVYLSSIPKVEPVKDECHNDEVFRDMINLITNFEAIFVSFTRDNYNTYSEKDVKRLVSEGLKANLIQKLYQLEVGNSY